MTRNRTSSDSNTVAGGFPHRRLGTAIGALALAACALSPAPAGAVLVLSPDGVTVYDTVNHVTWLADAHYPATNRFGLPLCSGPGAQPCVNASGSMSYASAAAWVSAMNAATYLGHSDWQLPTTPTFDPGCGKKGPNGNSFGYGCSASALGSLYYNALGLRAPDTAVPIPANAVGPFTNLQPYLYWSQVGASADGYHAFSFATGWRGANTGPHFIYLWPMVPGKIAGTPPAQGLGLQVNPGGQTVYDPVATVTWLANANLAATDTMGLPPCQDSTNPTICVNHDGGMNWDSASQFVVNMNSANGTGYLGQTNWEIPPVDPSCSGWNCNSAANPMGELFYGQFGLSTGASAVATPDIAVGPFHDIQPYLCWSCLGATVQDACMADGPAPNFEWSFSFGNGFEGTDVLANGMYATAYFIGPRTGPASIWLPVASHANGLNGSQWRSDAGVLNPGRRRRTSRS